jgi:hypothetical protein
LYVCSFMGLMWKESKTRKSNGCIGLLYGSMEIYKTIKIIHNLSIIYIYIYIIIKIIIYKHD